MGKATNLFLVLALVTTALLMAATPAQAAGSEVGAASCSGELVETGNYEVITIDSGQGGNYWAEDDFDSEYRVYEVEEGVYCVEVEQNGTFVTFAGTSPGNTGTVGAGVEGTASGGFVANVEGYDPNSGDQGFFDYMCDQFAVCLNYTPWSEIIFENPEGYTYLDWGWYYETCANGSWTNNASGNSGDITGDYIACVVATAILGQNRSKLTYIPSDVYIGLYNEFEIEFTGQMCDLRLFGGDLSKAVYAELVPASLRIIDGHRYAKYRLSDADGMSLIDLHGADSVSTFAYCHGSSGKTANGPLPVTIHH